MHNTDKKHIRKIMDENEEQILPFISKSNLLRRHSMKRWHRMNGQWNDIKIKLE